MSTTRQATPEELEKTRTVFFLADGTEAPMIGGRIDPEPMKSGNIIYIDSINPVSPDEEKARGFTQYSARYEAIMRLADATSGDKELEKVVIGAMLDCLDIWKQRHRKYGRSNIGQFGASGCLVRLFDKAARLKRNYFDGTPSDQPDDTIEDSWIDAVNYAVMGLLCHRGHWPK